MVTVDNPLAEIVMPPEQNVRAEQILKQARSFSSVEEMEAFIRREVGDDETLLSEVTDILGKHLSDDETVPASEELLARLKINARADVQDDPLLGTKIGSCTLKRLIGSGGMGTVYEAMQESPRRRVAMKMMKTKRLTLP